MTRGLDALLANALLVVVALSGCGGGSGAPDSGARDGATATVLAADCRGPSSDPRCAAFDMPSSGSIGSGPTLPQGTGGMYGGYVDAAHNRIVIAGYDFMDLGYVLAVDLTSGDRTLISGSHNDTRLGIVTRGTGPDLGHALDVDLGPDGRLYTFGDNGIHAIDATTGDRTQIIAGGHPCMHAGQTWFFGSNNNTGDAAPGLAIGTDGSLYTAVTTNFGGSAAESHAGVVKVTTAGVCTMVTMSSDNMAYRLGSGPLSTDAIAGLAFVGSTLHWTAWPTGSVYSVDVATGARRLVSSALAGAEVGTGPPADDGFVVAFDATTAWTSGDTSALGHMGSAMVSVDLATGNRVAVGWDSDGPLGGFDQAWWAYPHPTMSGVAIVAAGNGGLDHAIVLFELATGNNVLLSR